MADIVSSLKVMQRMERMATAIYRPQVGAFRGRETADRLKAASVNEQQHAETLGQRIEQLKGTPSKAGIFYQIAGMLLAFATTLLGKVLLFKTDIWIEKQAIKDYGDFLQKVHFDETTQGLIHKIMEDEKRHLETWEKSIEILKGQT